MGKISFQVSQNGLDIVGLLVERLGHGFKVYVNTVIGAVVDRLGDTREVVRERANHVLTRSVALLLKYLELSALVTMPIWLHSN